MKYHSTHYGDLLGELEKHTWLVLLYAAGSALILYALGFFAVRSLFFLVIEFPTLLATTYVLWPNANLSSRVPFIWTMTAFLIWGINEGATRNLSN